MLPYDSERTEQIVQRLRNLNAFLRVLVVFVLTATSASIGFIVDAITGNRYLFSSILGALFGLVGGLYTTVVLAAVLEWMCQMLIALGAIAEHKSNVPK